jgi:hypothetical protein
MSRTVVGSRTSVVWRALRYIDPAEAGFLKRMIRLAAIVVAVGACGLLAAGALAARTATGRYAAAFVLSVVHHHERALGLAQGLVRDYPGTRWEYYRLEAFNLRHLDRIPESLAVYDDAIAVLPDQWWPHSHRCFYNAMLADAVLALDSCDRSIALAPDDPAVAYERRAIARAMTGDRAGAIADLQVSLAAYARNDDTPWQIAVRRRWLETLQGGGDPFTPDEIAREMTHY